MSQCVICLNVPSTPHMHHVIPQCYGGVDGPQVLLCASCHNDLHNQALSILSFKDGKCKKVRHIFKDEQSLERAKPLISAIVLAAQNNSKKETVKIQLELPTDIYSQLKFIQKDTGKSSLIKTLVYCIQYTYSRNCNNVSTNKIW